MDDAAPSSLRFSLHCAFQSAHASAPFDILGIVRMMWWFLILGSTSGVVLFAGIALYLRVRRHMKKEASLEVEREREAGRM